MNNEQLKNIRLVATDMDGTLTNNEKFTSEVIKNIEKLRDNKIFVVIVTGRSSGWVNAIANYLPITGAIAENGGLFYGNDHNLNLVNKVLTPIVDRIFGQSEGQRFCELVELIVRPQHTAIE